MHTPRGPAAHTPTPHMLPSLRKVWQPGMAIDWVRELDEEIKESLGGDEEKEAHAGGDVALAGEMPGILLGVNKEQRSIQDKLKLCRDRAYDAAVAATQGNADQAKAFADMAETAFRMAEEELEELKKKNQLIHATMFLKFWQQACMRQLRNLLLWLRTKI